MAARSSECTASQLSNRASSQVYHRGSFQSREVGGSWPVASRNSDRQKSQ